MTPSGTSTSQTPKNWTPELAVQVVPTSMLRQGLAQPCLALSRGWHTLTCFATWSSWCNLLASHFLCVSIMHVWDLTWAKQAAVHSSRMDSTCFDSLPENWAFAPSTMAKTVAMLGRSEPEAVPRGASMVPAHMFQRPCVTGSFCKELPITQLLNTLPPPRPMWSYCPIKKCIAMLINILSFLVLENTIYHTFLISPPLIRAFWRGRWSNCSKWLIYIYFFWCITV